MAELITNNMVCPTCKAPVPSLDRQTCINGCALTDDDLVSAYVLLQTAIKKNHLALTILQQTESQQPI